jgi:predicted  nucleic acid-binding Zn-ribbon protein
MSKNAVIESIRERVARLVAEHRKLRGEYDRVWQQAEKTRAENRQLREQVALMERRIGQLELQQGMEGGSGDKKKARARVNRLMREVDKCIALLNK